MRNLLTLVLLALTSPGTTALTAEARRTTAQAPRTPHREGASPRDPTARRAVSAHAERYGARPEPYNVHMTFDGDPARSVVVQWTTDARTLASAVRLEGPRSPRGRVVEGDSFLLPGAPNRRQHQVRLGGLLASTRYRYTAGGALFASPEGSFVTAPGSAAEVRLAVLGDARGNYRVWERVARAVLARQPDAVIFLGDAVSNGASAAQWDAFFARGSALFAALPLVWVDGNHEWHSALYEHQFALPFGERPERWYALTYGPLRLIVLNDATVPERDMVGVESSFLRESLASVDRARTPWVITVHHKPTRSDALGNPPALRTRAAWEPLFDRFHVDLDLTAHAHVYESSEPLFGGRVVNARPGTRYLVFGGAGAPLYDFGPRAPWVHHRERTHGFGLLTASATTLRWEAFRVDGSLIESIDLAPSFRLRR